MVCCFCPSMTYVWTVCAAWILTTFPLYLLSPGISLKLVGSALSDSVLVVVSPHHCFSMTLSLSLSLSLYMWSIRADACQT